MPAILILGFDMEIARVMIVAVLGGLLGILMMIPLRRAFIVQQHGAAQVSRRHRLRRGAEGGRVGRVARERVRCREGDASPAARVRRALGAKTIFAGFGIGLVYQTRDGRRSRAGRDMPEKVFGAPLQGGVGRRGDLARAARRRLHHRPAHRVDHVRGRRARLPGADPDDRASSARRHSAIVPPGTMPISETWAPARSAAPTSSTSAPARSRRAASSACSARCR